jgi:hypothetical protein
MGLGDRAAALGREILNRAPRYGYNRTMARILATATMLTMGLIAATGADAQMHRKSTQREIGRVPAAVLIDKRDRIVTAPGAFSGKSYWLALAQCGGTYFKLNTLFADSAMHARVDKPDPSAVTDFTLKLDAAINTATVYFDATERFLMADRGIERADAVLTYDGPSRAAGERFKTLDAALAGAKACPALYRTCQEAYPKACSEPLAPAR